MLPTATAELYRANQRRVVATLAAVLSQWSLMGDDFDASWAAIGPRMATLTAASMVGAASDGAASVGPALAQTGFDPRPVAEVDPLAFGRTATDGRPLLGLLFGAVVHSRVADAGSLQERLGVGRTWLESTVHTQVVDASRLAAGAAITARPGAGYVRMVNPPCCQDCAVQAGRWFSHNAGFERHPGCDCIHRPAHESEGRAGYAETVNPDQITDLSVGQRFALEDGADLGRVVNSRRDRMRTAGAQAGRPPRPSTPDGIYLRARSRDEAVAMLRRYGYLK